MRRGRRDIPLTAKEYAILLHLARNAGRVQCPHCAYAMDSAGSVPAHVAMAHPEIPIDTVAPRLVGFETGMDLLLTGRWFDAEEALRWGLLKEITTPADLLPKAWDLARLLESGPPLVYAAIKEVVREAEAMRFRMR